MSLNLYFSSAFIVYYLQSGHAFLNAHCDPNKLTHLSPSECSDSFNAKSHSSITHGLFSLNLIDNNNFINISRRKKPQLEQTFLPHYIRLTSRENTTHEICTIVENDLNNNNNLGCLPVNAGATFLLETETSKYLFTVPNRSEILPFPYIEIADLSNLLLLAEWQKEPALQSVTIEVFKSRNDVTTLQDVRVFDRDSSAEIEFNFVTYNEPGDYFFAIQSSNCEEEVCPKITTPKVHIGRKSTTLIIGIVGASFILPFVLFMFHLLSKQYQQEEISEEKIIIIYKSSFDKHNQIVTELDRVLKQSSKSTIMVEASKVTKKLCSDILASDPYVVYVAPCDDIDDVFSKPQKKSVLISFAYTDDNLEHFSIDKLTLMHDFDKLLTFLQIDSDLNSVNLAKMVDEATNNLPKIVITDSDSPKEEDKLISNLKFEAKKTYLVLCTLSLEGGESPHHGKLASLSILVKTWLETGWPT